MAIPAIKRAANWHDTKAKQLKEEAAKQRNNATTEKRRPSQAVKDSRQ